MTQYRPALPAYTTGTVTGTAGSAIIAGAGTLWITTDSNGNAVNSVNGGDVFITASGPIPIKSVDSASQITLEAPVAAAIAAGSAYRIIKYTQSTTGVLLAALTALQAQGTDTGGGPGSFTVDNGVSRIKTRVAAAGHPQLAVGPTGTVDASLLTAIDVDPATGLVGFPVGIAGANKQGKNGVQNGNFAVNIRNYASGASIASLSHGHDRWKAWFTTTAYTFTQAVPDTQINITSGALAQIIDNADLVPGIKTLSWTGTSTVIVQYNIGSTAYGAGTYGGSSPQTFTIPAGATNLTLVFGTGTLGNVQLEAGSVQTSFERRFLSTELALCQRYARVLTDADNVGGIASGSYRLSATFFFPDMRIAPSASLLAAGNWYVTDEYAANYQASPVSILALNGATPRSANILLLGFSGMAEGTFVAGLGYRVGTASILLSSDL